MDKLNNHPRKIGSVDDLALHLRKWAIEEMRWREETVPSVEDLTKICTGQMADIWQFVIGHVMSTDSASKIRMNVLLQRKIEGSQSKSDIEQDEMKTRQRLELEREQKALQEERNEVRRLAETIMGQENAIKVVADRVEALDVNNSLLEAVLTSYRSTTESACELMSDLQQEKGIFFYSSASKIKQPSLEELSLIEDIQKLGQMAAIAFEDNLGRNNEFFDNKDYRDLMDNIFSTYSIEEITSAVIAVSEKMSGCIAKLDGETDAAMWNAIEEKEKLLLRGARRLRIDLFHQICEQETIAAKAEEELQNILKKFDNKATLNMELSEQRQKRELIDANIKLAAETAEKQYLQETMLTDAHCKSKCREALQLLQERQEAISSIDYMQKYDMVKKLVTNISDALCMLKEAKSEAINTCGLVNLDIPLRTMNGLKCWQSTDELFSDWNSFMLSNWTSNRPQPLSVNDLLNASMQTSNNAEMSQELGSLMKFLSFSKTVLRMDHIATNGKRVESIMRTVVDGDNKKMKHLLPKLNAGLKLADDSVTAVKKMETSLANWWENPVHNFQLANKIFGSTFHEWMMRWKQASS